MPSPTRAPFSLAAVGALALAVAGTAVAAPSRSADFGRHVAACAQEHLGQRTDPPQITCTHDGMKMTFPTFGAMVRHMQEMHGA